MKRPAKFLFDECVNLPVLEAIRSHLGVGAEPPTLAHVLELELQGELDEVWIPRIAPEGWIVVSSDRGKGGKSKGEKLPMVCVRAKVTHILLAASIHHKKSEEKAAILIAAWPKIDRARKAEPGTRFSLRYTEDGKIVMEKRPLTR